MSSIYHLYKKTHNITGLKYLGVTTKDPFRYPGSGLYWQRHLKQHGNNVSTEIIFITPNKQELKEKCLYYSVSWNVSTSEEWANLVPETGDDCTFISKPKTDLHKQNISKALKNRIFSKDWKLKISISKKSKPSPTKGKRKKRFQCSKCHKMVGGKTNLIRWHENNCRFILVH